MALIPYHREGRRVRGLIRLNINYIKKPYQYNLYKTGIAVGDYPVDHHHGQYPGKVPQIVFPQLPSFNIPVGALIPEKIDHLMNYQGQKLLEIQQIQADYMSDILKSVQYENQVLKEKK